MSVSVMALEFVQMSEYLITARLEAGVSFFFVFGRCSGKMY